MDAARLKAAMNYNPGFFRAGGWIALGGTLTPSTLLHKANSVLRNAATHFHFIREIPMFSRYEVRMSIVAWDQKWFYVISRFVTFPSKKDSSSNKLKSSAAQTEQSTTAENEHLPAFGSVHTPADGTATPLPPPSSANGSASDGLKETSEATANAKMQALAASQANTLEPDGATLNCVAVAEMCYKHGRITVPPDIVMSCDGFSVPSPTPSPSPGSSPYSKTNPPPHWEEVQKIFEEGGMKGMVRFLRGGGGGM